MSTASVAVATKNGRRHAEREKRQFPDVEAARRRLAADSHRELHSVRCDTVDGVLVLSGCVQTYYLKQLAQEIVRQAGGVRTIENRLGVGTPSMLDQAVARRA